MQNYPAKNSVMQEAGYIKLYFAVNTASLSDVNEFCFKNGIILNHLLLKKKSLESKFFELTNN